ncbi:MAG: cysteine hydrolase [Caldisericia bacterium]|nr:cysteine hydrolase [Caldisericia bacterium]
MIENLEKICLLIIDMQYDFVEKKSPLYVNTCEDIIPNIKKILEKCREKNLPRIFVKREHRKSGIDIDKGRYELFKKENGILVENTIGSQIVEELRPLDNEIVVIKRRFSAFFGTELELILKRLDIKTLVLTGIQTPNCIRATAFDAISYDYDVIVISDATKSKSEEIQISNLKDLIDVNIRVIKTTEFLNMIKLYIP